MSVSAEQRTETVAAAIKEIGHIATLPEVTMRIIELVENPASTAQDLHNVVSYDPALCTRILKVVNSAFYGLPGQIGSINRAIVLLGLNAVKNIAIAASLAKLFRGGELCPSFSAKGLWQHSVAVAVGSKLIADRLKFGLPDEAFLAGLLHDIGVVVEMQADRDKLIDVVESLGADEDGVPSASMLEAEDRVFGANHQDFGAALCEKWKFPKSFVFVAGAHHDPLSVPENGRTLSCMVYIADRIVAEQGLGFRLDLQSTEIDGEVLSELDLTREKVEEIAADLPAQIEEAEQLLG